MLLLRMDMGMMMIELSTNTEEVEEKKPHDV